ncbi:MAG TPA: response regulator [Acidimicrobiia bacterium]|nr:response regulator [Acidimicrobiia bacterium]
MDLNTPELTRIFREELDERSSRLVAGARALADDTLDPAWVPDLVRDAHTIKGSAGLLGYESIREAATQLEQMWRLISEGHEPDADIVMAMENSAGQLVAAMSEDERGQLSDLTERLLGGIEASRNVAETIPLRRPEPGSLGGLLSSVSESLLGGATRVDTGDLYRLINRIVEVALDTEALADLALVSIEGSDPAVFRRSWRSQLEKLSTSIGDIQDQAVALANVSFRDAVSTFPQFVRYLGRRMGKDVRFEIIGDDVQLDRQIVDLLREPLRHLLVNAVDHGIEGGADRIAAGKMATGVVRIAARVVDEGVEVSVSDDGAGINWDLVAEQAVQNDLPFDLTPLLFQPGFSTNEATNDFSGSGEGLAAARDSVERVHGAVHIESVRGQGTTVTMTLPMSMVLQNVVVVAAGDQFWGFPEAAVEAAMPLSKAEIKTTNGGRELHFESGAIPIVSLSQSVGTGVDADESELLIMSTRFGLVAVTVGELIDRRRVAVKNLGPILEGPGHVTGAALLGGGQVLVVIDPNFLGILARRRPRLVGRRPRILVVDDSAGVRQLLSATLNGAGFEVEVAGGAREAVMAMAEDDFDAMVVDYSMPRSNGVELVRAMRAAEVRVPIVMVSGVATQEEKRAAWEVGVNAYLDKFDLRQGVLTTTLRRLIGLEDVGTA